MSPDAQAQSVAAAFRSRIPALPTVEELTSTERDVRKKKGDYLLNLGECVAMRLLRCPPHGPAVQQERLERYCLNLLHDFEKIHSASDFSLEYSRVDGQRAAQSLLNIFCGDKWKGRYIVQVSTTL